MNSPRCCKQQRSTPFKPDDHSKSVPPLPIPNRTVKRLRADDSADPCVKVGHRQAVIPQDPSWLAAETGFAFCPQRAPCAPRQEVLPKG